jgi:hypothetical protein
MSFVANELRRFNATKDGALTAAAKRKTKASRQAGSQTFTLELRLPVPSASTLCISAKKNLTPAAAVLRLGG